MQSANAAFCLLLILCSIVSVIGDGNSSIPKKEKSPIEPAYPGLKQSRGFNVTLKCIIPFNNATGISWMKNGSRVNDDSRHISVIKSNQTFRFAYLKIYLIEASDYGIYECNANISGKVSSARIKLSEKKIRSPPITHQETLSTVSLKADASLKCFLPKDAASSITWLKNGTEVKLDERHNISESSNVTKLEIKSIEADDFDTYTCITNTSGKVQSASIKLVEKKETPLVKATQDELKEPLKGNATLRCDFSKPPSSYSWWKGGTKVGSDKRHTIKVYSRGNTTTAVALDIKTLETGDYGVYKCHAIISNQTLSANIQLAERTS